MQNESSLINPQHDAKYVKLPFYTVRIPIRLVKLHPMDAGQTTDVSQTETPQEEENMS